MGVQANRGGVERLDRSRLHHDYGFQSLNAISCPGLTTVWLARDKPRRGEIDQTIR